MLAPTNVEAEGKETTLIADVHTDANPPTPPDRLPQTKLDRQLLFWLGTSRICKRDN